MASTNANVAQRAHNELNSILPSQQHRLLDHLKKGSQAVARIDAVLRLQTDMTIDRFIIGGSSTGYRLSQQAEITPDFYVYPFFNLDWSDTSNAAVQRAIPKLVDRILRVFKSCNWTTSKIDQFTVRVQLVEKGTLLFLDVSPAINFFKGEAKKAQWHQVVQRCANANTNLKYLSASASEKAVEFLVKQDEFTRSVVMLTKIWNEIYVKVQYMNGRYFIIELVAVKAVQDEVKAMGENKTLTGALVRFFKYMQTGWMSLKIVFDEVEDLPECAHDKYLSRKEESGVLINPVNPYVNFLEDETVRSGWGGFQVAASTCLAIWERLKRGDSEEFAGLMVGMEKY